MAEKTFDISLLNTPLGVPLSKDGVMMLISKAAAVSDTFALDTPYLITSLKEAETKGITASYDTANAVAFHQHISEFYDNAGDGALLWIVGIAKATAYATFVASDTFKETIRLTKVADPLDVPKVIGLAYEVPATGQSSTDFPSDVTATLALLQSIKDELWTENIRVAFILDGFNMSTSVTMTTIGTIANKTTPCTAVCISGTKNNRVSSVGLALGALAKRTVGECIGSGVSVSPLVLATGKVYLTNQLDMDDKSINQPLCDAFGAKNFLFIRKFGDNAGWYFHDDSTADAAEMSLSTLAANRIANKLCYSIYNYFLKIVNANPASALKGRGDGVVVDANTGNAADAWCFGKQADFKKTYIQPLKDSGDIADASITVTGVNYTSLKKLTIKVKVVKNDPVQDLSATFEFGLTI